MFMQQHSSFSYMRFLSLASLLLFGNLLLASNTLAQQISASATVDRNPVTEYSAFVLTVQTTENIGRDGFQPGNTIGEFSVRGTAMSSSVSSVNGVSTRSIEWRITLVAPTAGQYEIPSLQVGSARTSPIQLQVLSADSEPVQSRNYFIETELSSLSPYVQQQITYTVRLFLAEQLESGSLSFPQLEHVSVEQLGQDRQSQEIIDGRRFQVLTRTYGITPRRSGELTIPGVRFDGQVRRFPSGGFSALGRIEPVSTRGEEKTVQVQARPSDYSGAWLPSEQVSIEENWDPNTRVFRVGEPITRSITLTAAGVRGEQLPDILPEYPSEFRVYPDRGQRESALVRGMAVARATFTTAIIPAEAGQYTLPSVTVPWWNTRTNQMEMARLPERTVEVANPPGGLTLPGSVNEPSAATPASETTGAEPAVGAAPTAQLRIWQALSGILLLLLIASLGAAVWYRQQLQRGQTTKTAAGYIPEQVRKPLQRLKQACKESDPQAARTALLAWHKARTGRPARGLSAVAAALPQDIQIEPYVASLEQALYSAQPITWQHGAALWQAIQQLHQKRRQPETELPPLYPQ